MTDKNPIEDLREIRRMMESSTKFLSLSGLSGVFAGLTALIGAWFAHVEFERFSRNFVHFAIQGREQEWDRQLAISLVIHGLVILVVALGLGALFTWLKAKKQGKSLWTPLSIRLIISLMVPLGLGGLFLSGMFYQGLYFLIPPTTLMIYGFSLLNASKFVHVELKYLAFCELALGILAIFMIDWSFTFWIIGFGVLHVLYGTIMYFKYDRN